MGMDEIVDIKKECRLAIKACGSLDVFKKIANNGSPMTKGSIELLVSAYEDLYDRLINICQFDIFKDNELVGQLVQTIIYSLAGYYCAWNTDKESYKDDEKISYSIDCKFYQNCQDLTQDEHWDKLKDELWQVAGKKLEELLYEELTDEDVEYRTLVDTYHGYVGLCPECYDPAYYMEDKRLSQEYHLAELEMDKRRNEREGKEVDRIKYKLQCGCLIGQWDDIIMVDEAIAHPVMIFNQLGYTTTNSCSGHPYQPGAMYVDFDQAYEDIKRSYGMLTVEQMKMLKLEKWVPGKNNTIEVYSLDLTASSEFVLERTIENSTNDEHYRLMFNRDAILGAWEKDMLSDSDKWLGSWGNTSVKSVAKYGPMAPTIKFVNLLYKIIHGCMSISH